MTEGGNGMNRTEYNEVLKNVMGILRNPNGNFGKKFMSGNAEKMRNS